MKREADEFNLLDEAPVVVWLTDREGCCVFVNRRWVELTGQTLEASLGAGWAKYADVEEARVRVWEERGCLYVVVEDSGKGFDVGAAARSRSDSGFGLFSIRERLAAVGGKFTLTSTPGQGTRVALEVPLIPEGAEEKQLLPCERHPPEETEPARVGSPNIKRQQITIVVADDHAMVRQGLATLLSEDKRLEVVAEAADGLEPIDAVEAHHPDVMLVDLNMPRMNGIEATREIHRRWPDTIVIGLSVQDDDATGRAILDAGAAAFLSKAGDSDRMIETILELGKASENRGSRGNDGGSEKVKGSECGTR